jgi:hypothetical protein
MISLRVLDTSLLIVSKITTPSFELRALLTEGSAERLELARA